MAQNEMAALTTLGFWYIGRMKNQNKSSLHSILGNVAGPQPLSPFDKAKIKAAAKPADKGSGPGIKRLPGGR